MTKQHVAFYMHDLSGGGVERMRLALISQLQERGIHVTLLVGSRSGMLVDMLPVSLEVVVLGGAGTIQVIAPLIRALRHVRPGILVSSLDHNNVAALLAGCLSRTGTRVVICQHNALSAEAKAGWRYRAIPWLYWLLQGQAHGIVAVSKGVADDLANTARIPRHRITPIYNPVVEDGFDARSAGPAPHIWLESGNVPVFLFAGRLAEQKNPALLVRAFALCVRRVEAKLIILGEGPLLPGLRTLVAELGIGRVVAFVGFQPNPLPWIAHASCLVLSSRYEGLGNVIVEALACGTPVVATDCPHGPREILRNGALGALVPMDDPDRLCDAMLGAVQGTPDCELLRRRAADFTAAACADAHLALFDQLPVSRDRKRRTFGITLSSLPAAAVIERVLCEPAGDRVRLVVTPNIDHVRLLRHRDFAASYAFADLVCPDGFPVLLYARLKGLRLRTRVTGCDLFRTLADHSVLPSKRLAVVVESERTAASVRRWGRQRGLDALLVLTAPPRLADNLAAQAVLAQAIRDSRPDILVITLGAPLSEVFVHRNQHVLAPCWALCVGQALRVYLGLVHRAPLAWRRFGMEWLWRIFQEPRRLSSRYALSLAWFPLAVLIDLLQPRAAGSADPSRRPSQ